MRRPTLKGLQTRLSRLSCIDILAVMQDMDTDTTKIRRALDYAEVVPPGESLTRTIAWERSEPPDQAIDCAAENSILADLGD